MLADACGRSLTLTGTLLGGYSSTLCSTCSTGSAPDIRSEFGRSEEGRWINRYGFVEHSIGKDDGHSVEDGRNSRRRKYRKVVKERPGLAPSALFHLIGNSVFLRLSDVASGLPNYDEQVMLTAMDPGHGRDRLLAEVGLRETVREAAPRDGQGAGGRLAAAPLHVPTVAAGLPRWLHAGARRSSIPPRASRSSRCRRWPRIASTQRRRRSWVWSRRNGWLAGASWSTRRTLGTRDITGRMDDMLTRHGFKVAVMKADSVAPERREAWVAEKVKQGVDVIICHPRLVQTGLDLVDFPTIVWYETDYSVYTMRQASRRSWRIGQTRPVKVIFMAYRNTLQADALKLVAKKLQSSLAVEGELPEDGLAAYGDDGDDLMLALARKLVNGNEDDAADTVEAAFRQARASETESEGYLVDDGWQAAEVELRGIVEVHADTAEKDSVVAGDEADIAESPQTLFSWSEFMAEPPAKPKSRGRDAQPSLSLFEWAVATEQAQEAEREKVAVPA